MSAKTVRGSEAFTRLRLRERLRQANPNTVYDSEQEDFDERFTFEKSEIVPSSDLCNEKHAALNADLEDVKARLEELCREEHESFLDADEEDSDWERYRRISATLNSDEPGMDTSVLERIRNGEGPRDTLFEDMLAPLRSRPLVPGTEESKEDMLEVLLAWNKRITDDCNDDLTARKAFIAALEERVNVVDKVTAIVSDDTNSNQNNEIGHDGILEPSQRRLLKAIQAYRPETRSFKNQDPFNMLIILLAHVRQEEFEVADKDDCINLALWVLIGQGQLKYRFDREKQRRSYQSQKEDAEQDGNPDKVRRCTARWRVYNKRLAERTMRKLMTRIQCARNGMRKIGIDELLKLAVLRSAQPRAERDDILYDYTPSWGEILDRCTQADDYDTLNNKLGNYFSDLQTTLEVTASKVQDMKTTHNMVLSRTAKFVGADLRGRNETERARIMTARLNDPVTVKIMEETLEGMLSTRLVATQMLVHVNLMEESISGLLEAAAAKHGDLTGLIRLINRDERPISSNEADVEDASIKRSEDEEV
ncbi:uncharacterized protein ALTATR162_LOCUS1224 [Alternaria atra]|uniref:Uncharacterized protein n=1 Tax=Alternaria atra TaxID=119953 RepID=A0A8J2N1G0_9PLEO|nr:uncharacterized protein ALTATR162_LOCUS1224 [Alternaria atra]CAG5142791.1 unnamed protein product [Alternaria atra]